jgi:hypothetical protein
MRVLSGSVTDRAQRECFEFRPSERHECRFIEDDNWMPSAKSKNALGCTFGRRPFEMRAGRS